VFPLSVTAIPLFRGGASATRYFEFWLALFRYSAVFQINFFSEIKKKLPVNNTIQLEFTRK
jgi:hypothetical protein